MVYDTISSINARDEEQEGESKKKKRRMKRRYCNYAGSENDIIQGKCSINGTTITATNAIPSRTHDSGFLPIFGSYPVFSVLVLTIFLKITWFLTPSTLLFFTATAKIFCLTLIHLKYPTTELFFHWSSQLPVYSPSWVPDWDNLLLLAPSIVSILLLTRNQCHSKTFTRKILNKHIVSLS